MLTLNPKQIALLLLLAATGTSAGEAVSPPPVVTAPAPPTTGKSERPFRVRLGVLGGAAMQKTQFELGGAWDFFKLSSIAKLPGRLRLVADFTVGVRPTEISLIPMAGARLAVPIGTAPFEVAVGVLGGANLTLLRGSTAVAIPFRLLASGQYLIGDALGAGLEVSFDVGPLKEPTT